MGSCGWARSSCGLLVEACSIILIASSLVTYKLVPGFTAEYAFGLSACITTVLSLPVALWYYHPKDLKDVASEKWKLLARLLLAILNLYLSLNAVQYVTVSDVIAISKCSPLATALFGFLVYKERFSLCHILLLLSSVVGALFICRPDFIFRTTQTEEVLNKVLGISLSVGAALSTSLTYIVSKAIKKTPLSVMTFGLGMGGTAIFAPIFIARQSWSNIPCDYYTALAFASRAAACLGFLLRLLASRVEDVSRLAVMFVLDLPFVVACEAILTGTRHPWTSYVGLVIVVTSVTMSIVIRSREDRSPQQTKVCEISSPPEDTERRYFKETAV